MSTREDQIADELRAELVEYGKRVDAATFAPSTGGANLLPPPPARAVSLAASLLKSSQYGGAEALQSFINDPARLSRGRYRRELIEAIDGVRDSGNEAGE